MRKDLEKQIVFRANRLIRVRKFRCLDSMRWVFRLPITNFSPFLSVWRKHWMQIFTLLDLMPHGNVVPMKTLNTNGLIREYFPKGSDFVPITQKAIDDVIEKLNWFYLHECPLLHFIFEFSFFRIRSYPSSAKKQGYNMLEALTLSFRGTPLILAGAE